MTLVLEVTDRLSNRPEQLVEFANILGRSEGRIRVFEEIYRGQKKKTVDEIAKKLNLPNKTDRKSTRLNSSHVRTTRMPSSA